MQFLKWVAGNREITAILFGILVNTLGLLYNIYKFCRSGKAHSLQSWLTLLEAARRYEAEAEACPDYTSAEKLNYVLTRLRGLSSELGYPYDEEKFTAQVEADIAFSKTVNAHKSNLLE